MKRRLKITQNLLDDIDGPLSEALPAKARQCFTLGLKTPRAGSLIQPLDSFLVEAPLKSIDLANPSATCISAAKTNPLLC
jgi:hypothetical protein